MFEWITTLFEDKTKPVRGKDAHWCGFCKNCKDYTSFVSRGGFKNGGVEHCYDCGHEQISKGLTQDEIRTCVLHSYCHWEKWARLPYNWHELTEDQKWSALRDRPKKK